jgi:hypothetical protein
MITSFRTQAGVCSKCMAAAVFCTASTDPFKSLDTPPYSNSSVFIRKASTLARVKSSLNFPALLKSTMSLWLGIVGDFRFISTMTVIA